MSSIVNKVAESGIISIDLEKWYPGDNDIVQFDLKDYLFMELILKEKDFREALKALDITEYKNKVVAITCSTDAVIPMWAYMLVTSLLQPVCKNIFMGTREEAVTNILMQEINKIDITQYSDKRVVVKGCGEKSIPATAYVAITALLRPVAKSIMFGEPCSTVPVFKKAIQQ